MPSFLAAFVWKYEEFGALEVESIAELLGIRFRWLGEASLSESPFLRFEVDSEEDAVRIAKRSVLLRGVHDVWACAPTYDALCEQIDAYPEEEKDRVNGPSSTFKFEHISFGLNFDMALKRERIERVAWGTKRGWKGKVKLKNPEYEFCIMEDHCDAIPERALARDKDAAPADPLTAKPRSIWFTRLVATSSRHLVDEFALPKRTYLGPTSMDAELSFIIANIAKVRPGSIVYDPFVGSGSLLVSAARFGAVTIGTDLDPRIIFGYGKGEGNDVFANFSQYNLQKPVAVALADAARPVIRSVMPACLDAIVCDPPYGIRAAAKKMSDTSVGSREAYALPTITLDIVSFAAKHLVVGGRVAFWLPTPPDLNVDAFLPHHPSMRLIGRCEQKLTSFLSRWLVVMEKDSEYQDVELSSMVSSQDTRTAALINNDLRSKMMHLTTGAKGGTAE